MAKKPHKHAELIKAWADGAEIQIINHVNKWVDLTKEPQWDANYEYRIKPETKPDVVRYTHLHLHKNLRPLSIDPYNLIDNLKLTFDGETGKLKSAEVLE